PSAKPNAAWSLRSRLPVRREAALAGERPPRCTRSPKLDALRRGAPPAAEEPADCSAARQPTLIREVAPMPSREHSVLSRQAEQFAELPRESQPAPRAERHPHRVPPASGRRTGTNDPQG